MEAIGELLEPGSSALAIVWENTWARAFVTAVRNSKGVLLAPTAWMRRRSPKRSPRWKPRTDVCRLPCVDADQNDEGLIASRSR